MALEIEAPAATDASPPGKPRKRDGRLREGDASAPVELEAPAAPRAFAKRPWPRIEVEMKKGERFFGLRRFAFVDPTEQANQFEPLVFEQLLREGVLAPRVGYARVALDGAPVGVMAVREEFSKELLESQERREGVFFRLDPGALPVARLEPDPPRSAAKSEILAAHHVTAAGLWAGFLAGRLAASEVFDVDLVARFLAVAELWNAEALLRPESLRFHFNPVTQRLEPVAPPGVLRTLPAADGASVLTTPWAVQLLADPALRAATRQALERLARAVANVETSSWRSETDARVVAALRADDPAASAFDFAPWVARAAAVLGSPSAGGPGAEPPPAASAGLRPDPAVPALSRNPVPRADLAQVLKLHGFLRWDEQSSALVAAPGTHTLRESLVLPEGAGLRLDAGTTLRFGPGAMLVGTGPLGFHGTAESPVVLEGLPRGEARGSWQGIAVLRSASPHAWEHVVVRDTTGVVHDGWSLSAGVTLRASDVRLASCLLRGNRTEDALNLITSRFDFRDVSIEDTTSDAFDCDFCEGRMVGGRIHDVGGDGIDVSGSTIEVEGVELRSIRDKAISVGERSRLVARRVRIDEVGTAVAGKDASEVIFEDSDVTNVEHVAIMAYTKKREYGPARVVARDIRMQRVGRAAVAALGSRIELDGEALTAEDVDIESLYSKGYMKK